MTLKEIKERLVEMGFETSVVFENPDYASAIIGVDESSGAVIYDRKLMIEHLMKEDGCSAEEAEEFIDYNTVRTIPYIREGVKPIIMSRIEL